MKHKSSTVFHPVVISGGSGTRLWPLSRASFPKQFAELFDGSLLSRTLSRLKSFGSPWVVTVQSMKTLTDRTYRDLGFPPSQILCEPMGRNTAPAIALVCQVLALQGKAKDLAGVFPADHLVSNEAEFEKALNLALQAADAGEVVTLGIHPSFASTGYGYIETTDQVFLETPDGSLAARHVAGFREKPSQSVAETFLTRGNFYWNAGMFVFRVENMIQHFQTHMPDMWSAFKTLKPDLSNLKEIYERIPSQSIDYGIMEKLKSQVCIPCDIGWSDVGSWDEVARLKPTATAVFEENSKHNFVMGAADKIYGLVGVEDLIVVDTSDAMLISRKGESQSVKELLEQIKKSGERAATEHIFEYRPWGSYEVLRDTDDFKSKLIRVEPGQQLSYQSHTHRAEHWVIVRGTPEVVLNDQVLQPKPGDSIFIPPGAKHRLRNVSNEIVEFVEVQVGTYFGEDDIVRYADQYGRT